MGYWQNWDTAATPYIPLAQVNRDFDIINLSFATEIPSGEIGELQFEACCETDEQIKAAVAQLQSEGKKVNISIGGATGNITINSERTQRLFFYNIWDIISRYNLDGIDIDFEGSSMPLMGAGATLSDPKSDTITHLVAVIKDLKQFFEQSGRPFTLTMAPETFYVQRGFSNFSGRAGGFLPVIDQLRDELTLLHVQHYNTGDMFAANGNIVDLNRDKVDFHVAMADMMITGFPTGFNGERFEGLRADQVAIGAMAADNTGDSGYTEPALLQNAVTCLIQKVNCSSYIPANAHADFRGLMTWSINLDEARGKSFSASHRPFLNGLPQ